MPELVMSKVYAYHERRDDAAVWVESLGWDFPRWDSWHDVAEMEVGCA